ncbi:MAG: integrase core domain-containing protein [Rickettsiaceae bacterium]|nr:integrase core domain-containing protein [Rickettsiaceae bacterium]
MYTRRIRSANNKPHKILGDWEILKSRKVPDKEIAAITGISRATCYRRRKALKTYGISGLKRKSTKPRTFRSSNISSSIRDLVLKLRLESPIYGKAKLSVILARDHGVVISESSVGRILKDLVAKGKVKRSISSLPIKRRRKFTSHAKKWEYGMKASGPGELIQIDHMTVTKHNITMREFRAWDPVTKIIVADVVSNATSNAAAKFLHKVINDLLFPVKSIQVDGGSEFMKHFEEECQNLGISLYVLPPKRPQWNGGVERGNRIFREEFYARNDINADSIGAFRHELQKAVDKYNTYRPHFNLKGLTPMEYTTKILAA